MSGKKLFCINCSKITHSSKDCTEPIISYGIICIKLDESLGIKPIMIEQFLVNKIIDFEEYNFSNLKNLSKIDNYKNKIKFLLVQRKHSFSYVDFIRGKYDVNNINDMKILFNLMCKKEIDNIINSDFEILWNNLWEKTSKNKCYQKEFEASQIKFNKIKKNNFIDLIDFKNLYETPEWGFPKGRKDKNEKTLDCAIREFEEEAGITSDKYIILNRLNTMEEIVSCNQNKTYKLVYYLGITNENIKLDMNNKYQTYEIGDLKWLSFEEVIPHIRPYFKEKINMIYQTYFLFLNLIENIKGFNVLQNINQNV
jgi:8-oxo-dGTP pyrophosphatase MutT (NUDIX family)